ncbi:MAG TPA: hypothetical protein VHY30_08675 [Verrucomicrobiae bacterium]|jgi:hypothetical protein|nr:hypothetical protein [Verrucomicrobiae bacterium]
MKDSAPHYQLWVGFWAGVGGFLAVAFCTWLATRIPQWREAIIDTVFRLIPSNGAIWLMSIALFLGGILIFVCACILSFRGLIHRLETDQATLDDIRVAAMLSSLKK